MKKLIHVLTFFFLCSILNTSLVFAQDSFNTEKSFKNTIRFNITNPVLFDFKSYIFGYERTLGEHQSFSVNAGTFHLAQLFLSDVNINSPTVQLQSGTKARGYNISADYRFYLKKENKYPSPHGVYIGPYAATSVFNRENTWTLNTANFQGDVTTDFKLGVYTVGGELGYQFILWKRVALDLILIGPGISNYSLKAEINTTLEPEDEAELFQKISDVLSDKFPGYSFVIDDQKFEKKGSVSTTSIGFRYMINVGFRF